MARKSQYEIKVEPRLPEVEAWCRDGVTEKDIAHNLRVSYASFKEYKKKYPAFSALLTRTKSYVDNVIVTGALLKRIEGYTETVKTIKYKYLPLENGEVLKVPAEETVSEVHYPGDTKAAEWWLAMRQRNKWSETVEAAETEETTVIEIPAITDLIEPADPEEVSHDESSVDAST